jgi:hypothetical protein
MMPAWKRLIQFDLSKQVIGNNYHNPSWFAFVLASAVVLGIPGPQLADRRSAGS